MTRLRPFTIALCHACFLYLSASALVSTAQDAAPAQDTAPAQAGAQAEGQGRAQAGGGGRGQAGAQQDPVGYFLGMSVGQQMAAQGFNERDFSGAGFAAGIMDALAGRDAALSEEQMQQAVEKIEATLRSRQQERMTEMRRVGAANLEKSTLFLEENAKKEGVKALPGGLQYKVIQSGTGESPSAEDVVKVHYTGKLIDGTTFDSSVERGEPAQFGVNQVIPGWRQALQQMKVGDKWTLFIPPQLAYGEQGAPSGAIGPNEALIFDVELLEIVR